MSSKRLNTNKRLSWEDPIEALSGKSAPSQSLLKIKNAGLEKVKDLLNILPLRIQPTPQISPFSSMKEGELFLGKGRAIGSNFSPAFGRRGKGKVQLFNVTLTVQDVLSDGIVNIKIFNAYPNIKNTIDKKDEFTFMGKPTSFKGDLQLVNPKFDPKIEVTQSGLLIEYPTVATVPGRLVKGIIDKIPDELWDEPLKLFKIPPSASKGSKDPLKVLHGKTSSGPSERKAAMSSLIYQEFLEDQLKIMARRKGIKGRPAPIVNWSDSTEKMVLDSLPYQLTKDQSLVLKKVREDFESGSPMMRMVQGDVGCGKTTVALVAAEIVAKDGGQSALMCPTESLALQHFKTFKKDASSELRVELLLGSHRPAEKKEVLYKLAKGDIDLLIGTHSLIQDTVEFKKLVFAIIDEQHKFGVEQRQKLSNKSDGVHTLIMTATPIPRTLQLAQYGDLDISTIKTMPSGRSAIKTRIVTPATYEKYLSFVKTRLSMGEQGYIVAPAIEESETLDIKNVNQIEAFYKKHFPEFTIKALHGKLKPEEKQRIFNEFGENKINLLISTSVVEVGINVVNATVMSVYNPDRFGLSSLHQLRGRVGRGGKPGFCFLVTDKKLNGDTLARLKVIERSTDGFEIAEADLKNRGEGDLFGVSQSGNAGQKRFGSIFEHFEIFDKVTRDLPAIIESHPEEVASVLDELYLDQKVSSTI